VRSVRSDTGERWWLSILTRPFFCKDQDGEKAILVDVTSASGLSRYVKLAEMGGGGSEALREVYESLSIGFQVNRALRIEHMMKRSLYGGLGLGGEEVRGLG
jgi:hypothetical protein